MAISDVLEKIGTGIEDGVKATGRVAATVLPALGKGLIDEEAPQQAAAAKQRQQQLEDAQIGAKSKVLESQLGQLQGSGPLYKADGTVMTPQERSEALSSITDQYTSLYSHPRHAGTLMEKLRQAVHPNGAVAGSGVVGSPAAAMSGFTAAPPPGANTEDEEKQKKSIDFFKKNMLPLFPADQQAKKLNEYIDHLNGLKEGAEPKPPKGMKAMEQGGVFFGIEDQDSGKQYLKEQLEPGGDAPDPAKKMYQTVQKAAGDKQKAAEAKEKERDKDADKRAQQAEERQNRAFSHALEMQSNSIQKMLAIGDYRNAKKEVTKVQEAYDGSLSRLSTMEQSYKSAVNNDQQAMTNLVANHIAMTKQQLGAPNRSPTRADFEEAVNSLPLADKLLKQFDAHHGVLSGLVLSRDQMDQMLKLAHEKVGTQKEHLDRVNDEYKDDLNPSDPATGKPVKKGAKVGQVVGKVAPEAGGKAHSLKTAMSLPFNQGKTEAQVKADLESHGYKVVP